MIPKTSNSKETKTQFLKMIEFDFIGRISKARFQKFFKTNRNLSSGRIILIRFKNLKYL